MTSNGKKGGEAGGSRWARLLARLRGGGVVTPSVDDEDLTVVVRSFDDTRAASSVLEEAASDAGDADGAPRWQPTAAVVLRHHLLVPEHRVAGVVELATQDGYARVEGDPSAAGVEPDALGGDTRYLALARVQTLDAVHCSQEQSRMASLAQRADGRALGWDGLVRATPDAADGGR